MEGTQVATRPKQPPIPTHESASFLAVDGFWTMFGAVGIAAVVTGLALECHRRTRRIPVNSSDVREVVFAEDENVNWLEDVPVPKWEYGW